ncbi:hypothetical protein K9N68_39650 (plasmid) [Kovacikia minuta CCNUW1]|uniref:ribbon-helix-helix domain-containing protein n=1 Tax=Kovacikia minuta TaxID=2931930 RepID=UPI001CCE4ABE|nr:hypothetical protein K9N68_39650 [Kovacikia minuta CCNUW1]
MKRIVLSVPDDFYEALQNLADQETRSVPNLVLWLTAKALREGQEQSVRKAS